MPLSGRGSRLCALRIDRVDIRRIVIGAVLTAGLAAGIAKGLLYRSAHTPHVGPTSATFSDATAVIGGSCLGLAVGALATAALVRHGPRILSGLVAGVLGFIGVAPFVWTTFSSDLSTGDKMGGLVFVAIPAAILVTVGAVIGAGIAGGRTRPGPTSSNQPG